MIIIWITTEYEDSSKETKYRTNYYDRNNRIINGGIDRDFVERRSGERIRETSIRSTSDIRDVSRNSVNRDSYVRAFRPSDDDVKRTRDVAITNVSRPGRKIDIERDRIEIRTSRDRDNNVSAQRSNDNNRERAVTRPERTNQADINRERPVIRNERPANTNTGRDRAVERAKQENERMIERSNRETQRREAAVRENNIRQQREVQRNETNRSRAESRTERQVERSVQSREKAAENRSSEKKAERSNPPSRNNESGSRERRR